MTERTQSAFLRALSNRLTAVERRLGRGSFVLPERLEQTGAEVTDWNNATAAGFYWSISAANSPIADDGGSSIWWSGVVTVHPGNTVGPRIFQEVREGRQATSGRVFRRYYNGTSWSAWEADDQIRRGTAARRAATTSRYWEMWQDTDGAQYLWIGNKTGGWRRFSGSDTAAAAAWAANYTSGTVVNVGRTITFTIPTVLEVNETLNVSDTNVGTGYGFMGMVSLVRNPTNTVITVRHMQLGAATTQALSIVWNIVQG